jgi:putative intracellular protease/amidase
MSLGQQVVAMKVAVLTFPNVQMLDLVGPVEVFHEAARQAGAPST